MLKAYRYRLYPTAEQKVLLAKTFGCCRYVYNWALGIKKGLYEEAKETVSKTALINRLASELKKENGWLCEVNSQSLQSALINLDTAFKNFFRSPGKVGYPKFKSRKGHQSFQCPQHCRVDFAKGTRTVPKMKDIPAILHRRFDGTAKTVTISMNPSGEYYASVLVDAAIEPIRKTPIAKETSVGIDAGSRSLAVCSDGQVFDNPKSLERSLRSLAMLQRRHSRKKKGSANREKSRVRIARLHRRVTSVRNDAIHKATHALTHNPGIQTVFVEDLDVRGMLQRGSHGLSRRIADASISRFLSVLEYKCGWYGINFVKVDRTFPSSQLCGVCGHVNQGLKLSQRNWTCPHCGTRHERDLNAAKNIKEFGLKTLPSGRGKVKPADCPPANESWQEETGKVPDNPSGCSRL